MRYLLLAYKTTVKTSNTDQCLLVITRRLQGTFHLFYVDNPNRPNIPIEVRQHNPNNFDNKDKKHFYRLWCKLDFDYDPLLDSLFAFHSTKVPVSYIVSNILKCWFPILR